MPPTDKHSALRGRLCKAYGSRTINAHAVVDAPDLYEVIGILQELDAPASSDLPPNAPPGWLVVPENPTEEMRQAGKQRGGVFVGAVYQAMVRSAPKGAPARAHEPVAWMEYDRDGRAIGPTMFKPDGFWPFKPLYLAHDSATSPSICYYPCDKHMGVPWTIKVGVAVSPRQVCPVCHPPDRTGA